MREEFDIKNLASQSDTSLRYGLTVQQFKLLTDIVVQPLKDAGARVWIFGSRARGDHRPVSDVDLLYDFPKQLKAPSGLLFEVVSNLEDSRFPFTLDLVKESDLAQAYKENILRERIEI